MRCASGVNMAQRIQEHASRLECYWEVIDWEVLGHARAVRRGMNYSICIKKPYHCLLPRVTDRKQDVKLPLGLPQVIRTRRKRNRTQTFLHFSSSSRQARIHCSVAGRCLA